jgi:hypothetical protein
MEKIMKKIFKQESESLKLLECQKCELEKAVEENDKLVERSLSIEAAAETTIREDIEELTGKMELLNCQLVKVRLTSN